MARLTSVKPRLGGLAPRVSLPPKTAEGFYQSPAWRNFVEERKRDADYRAALARRKHGRERLILDHVVERKDGGADFEPANTQWLTMSEHQAKTARARAKRATG